MIIIGVEIMSSPSLWFSANQRAAASDGDPGEQLACCGHGFSDWSAGTVAVQFWRREILTVMYKSYILEAVVYI